MPELVAISRPPLGEPAHETATYLFTVLMAVFFVGLAVWSGVVARRERSWLPLACLVGGLVSFAYEPLLDSVAHIFYPVGSPLIAGTIYGSSIPWFVVMAYVFWVGAGTFLLARYFDRRPTGRAVLQAYLLACCVEPLFEYPAVLSKALLYYGDQPFKLFDYPLYWPFGNSGSVFVAGYVLHLARPYLKGLRGFVVAALVPALGFFAVNGAGSWPVWLAINSDTPMAVIWLAGAAAIALHVSFVRLVALGADRRLSLDRLAHDVAVR